MEVAARTKESQINAKVSKKNHVSTWFNAVVRETVRGDIVSEEVTTATLDMVESLYPSLPSEDESETELKMTNPQSIDIKQILQRLEQMEVGNQTRDGVVLTVQKDIQEERSRKERSHEYVEK